MRACCAILTRQIFLRMLADAAQCGGNNGICDIELSPVCRLFALLLECRRNPAHV